MSSIKGRQSSTGHHAIMVAISEANPAGFTRAWVERDQLNSSAMGGIGAEGSIPLPEAVVIRIKKGRYFALQTHYLNATDALAKGETYIDVKLAPANAASPKSSSCYPSTA